MMVRRCREFVSYCMSGNIIAKCQDSDRGEMKTKLHHAGTCEGKRKVNSNLH